MDDKKLHEVPLEFIAREVPLFGVELHGCIAQIL